MDLSTESELTPLQQLVQAPVMSFSDSASSSQQMNSSSPIIGMLGNQGAPDQNQENQENSVAAASNIPPFHLGGGAPLLPPHIGISGKSMMMVPSAVDGHATENIMNTVEGALGGPGLEANEDPESPIIMPQAVPRPYLEGDVISEDDGSEARLPSSKRLALASGTLSKVNVPLTEQEMQLNELFSSLNTSPKVGFKSTDSIRSLSPNNVSRKSTDRFVAAFKEAQHRTPEQRVLKVSSFPSPNSEALGTLRSLSGSASSRVSPPEPAESISLDSAEVSFA